jgi:hypothetical protein
MRKGLLSFRSVQLIPHNVIFSTVPTPKKILTWEKLNYHVPVPGGTRRLLHDVQGYVGPGLTALMGASGAVSALISF